MLNNGCSIVRLHASAEPGNVFDGVVCGEDSMLASKIASRNR
jgi:hypothetical protein